MIDWDKQLLAKQKTYKLIPEVYTRFKDDIEIVIEGLEKGCKLEGDIISMDEDKKQEDENKSDSKITIQ